MRNYNFNYKEVLKFQGSKSVFQGSHFWKDNASFNDL